MTKKTFFLLLVLFTLLVVSIVAHLFSGVISLKFSDYVSAIFDYDQHSTPQIIAREFRLPRLVIGLIAGAGLAVSGMFMQTLFNNPLAGPYVLGINSGSSLFVAFSMMTGITLLQSNLGIISSALLGAFVFGILILFFSLVTRTSISLLLIGLMLGSFTGAIVTVLQSMSSAQELKAYTLWTMGSLQQIRFDQLGIVSLLFFVGILLSTLLIKPFNVLVIGDNSTQLLGLNVKRIRILAISITALFTGIVTAFCGPIAFVGLAVPNLTRAILKTQSHGKLLIGNSIIGAIFLILADTLIQLVDPWIQLPINAITSLVGAPFIVFIVLKKLR